MADSVFLSNKNQEHLNVIYPSLKLFFSTLCDYALWQLNLYSRRSHPLYNPCDIRFDGMDLVTNRPGKVDPVLADGVSSSKPNKPKEKCELVSELEEKSKALKQKESTNQKKSLIILSA